jgi:pimeloyl-ACP methyl ester carboxylesterase
METNNTCDDDNKIPQHRGQQRTITRGERTIGYSIAEAIRENDRSIAVVVFQPISGCSEVLSKMKLLNGYRCSVIAVDRPMCGMTSYLTEEEDDEDDCNNPNNSDAIDAPQQTNCTCHNNSTKQNNHDSSYLRRIRRHAIDVLAVLQQEKIDTVYVLGVCIGHPYAVQLCRRISHVSQHNIKVGGLTLVAPFVSTVCPYSWRIARLGAFVPHAILYGSIETMLSISDYLVPKLLRPSAIQRLVSSEEQEIAGGWTDEDFEEIYQNFLTSQQTTKNAMGVEARLGVSHIWQTEVCDKFAQESGYGLVLDDDDADTLDDVKKKESTSSESKIPIRIHASREDKLASLKSIEWISKRCYGNVSIEIEEEIHSHELMTFFGGPPRNPILLHKIVRNWGLLYDDE